MNPAALTLLALTSVLAQLPPSPDPAPLPIRGAVVDGSGRPVNGAGVWLAEALSPDEGRRFGMELWWSSLTNPSDGTTPILVHARTGADGTFSAELPAEAVARRSPPALAVWAANGRGPETRVAFRRLPRVVLADDPPARIEVGPTAHTELTVLTPDRKPAAGARVIPTRIGEALIPEPIGGLLAAATDATGRVVIEGLDAAALDSVRVEADGFGVQNLRVPDSRILALAPVGRIAGRLTTPHHEPIRGVMVRATSQVGGYAGSGQGGSAHVACDEQGQFTIPAIAAGMVSLELEFDRAKDFPLRSEAIRRLVVRAGQTAEIAIPMRETVVVRGLFREKGTGRPIPGVKVALNGQFGGDRFAMTDAAGRFVGRIGRNATQPYGWSVRIPSPFFTPEDMAEPPQRMPWPGIFELNLPPTELRRGVDVQGTVTGEDGRPVAGAAVEATWHNSSEIDQSAVARTDRTGGFVLHGIDPLADLDLTAWDGFASTDAVTVRAATAQERPIALTLRPTNTVPISGRVVDPDGRPIAGAAVRLRRAVRDKRGRVILDEPVADRDGTIVAYTGADGRYRAHGRFPAGADYYAEAGAPGRLAVRSTPAAGDRRSNTPAVLVLRRIQTIEGRVIDRNNQPVAGAVVRQSGDGPMPTETSTAADGRFQLPGAIEGPALVLAEKAGFRPSLQPVDDRSKPVEIALSRTDEPPAVSDHTLPSALSIPDEKVAHRLIEPLAVPVLAHGDDQAKYRFLSDAAVIDPSATIEWLDEVKFSDPEYANYVRQNLATLLARESLDEATAILEAGSAFTRALGYATLADDLPNLTADRKRALLEQAILNSKTVTPLWGRFRAIGRIADRLIDLGDVDRARIVLKEGRELARSILQQDRNARLSPLELAASLARLDLPAALKLIEDVEQADHKDAPGDRTWIYEKYDSQIAYNLADRSPADAETVLSRMAIRPASDRAIVAVCTRMASKDVARARRIAANRISPRALALRPYAFGLMARAVAATDRPEAVRLLDEAFDELTHLATVESERTQHPAAVVAVAVLPAVESIGPDRLAECLGRALSMRRPRGDQTRRGENAVASNTAQLAMLTARYDRGLAARILQPELDRLGSHKASFGDDYITPRVLAALALIDPGKAAAMVEALPDDPAPGTDSRGTKNQARRSVAKLLALHGDDRWRTVYQDFLYLWTPDQRSP